MKSRLRLGPWHCIEKSNRDQKTGWILEARITYISRNGPQKDHRDHNAQEYHKEYGIYQIEPVLGGIRHGRIRTSRTQLTDFGIEDTEIVIPTCCLYIRKSLSGDDGSRSHTHGVLDSCVRGVRGCKSRRGSGH